MIKTVPQAASWIDKVGLALLFPKADLVLPSLWEQVNGSADRNWAIRAPDGTFVDWTDEMGFLWGAKDELPAQGRACVGKHVAGVVACVSPRLLPALVAANRGEPPDEPVLAAVRDLGPLTAPQLREATGLAKKDVDRAVLALHKRLFLTSSHLVEEDAPWGALAHDLLDRKWPLGPLPDRDEARRTLAATVLAGAGELTAADLRGVVGWRPKECAAVLDEVAESREGDGFRIWAAP